MGPTFRGVPVVLDSDVSPVDPAYLEGMSQSVVQTVYYGVAEPLAEPPTEEKPEKRIDEMSMSDYRRGVGKEFNGGRLLP